MDYFKVGVGGAAWMGCRSHGKTASGESQSQSVTRERSGAASGEPTTPSIVSISSTCKLRQTPNLNSCAAH